MVFFDPCKECSRIPLKAFLWIRCGGWWGDLFPGAEIAVVGLNPNSKWGTGGIPHLGRIEIKRSSGTTCEFVLLGHVNGREIRENVPRFYDSSSMVTALAVDLRSARRCANAVLAEAHAEDGG